MDAGRHLGRGHLSNCRAQDGRGFFKRTSASADFRLHHRGYRTRIRIRIRIRTRTAAPEEGRMQICQTRGWLSYHAHL